MATFGRARMCDICIAPPVWKYRDVGGEKPIRLCQEHLEELVLHSLGHLSDDTIKRIKKEFKEKEEG